MDDDRCWLLGKLLDVAVAGMTVAVAGVYRKRVFGDVVRCCIL